jgi:hypothetical protein
MTEATWVGDPRKLRDELHAKTGLPVECAVLENDSIGVEFVVLNGKQPWRKAFVLDKGISTPQAFLGMLDAWRQEMQKKIRGSSVPGVLGQVLAEYGEGPVREALAKRTRVLN